MNRAEYVKRIESEIILPITEFMIDYEDCGYKQKNITKLKKILLTYINGLAKLKTASDEAIMSVVKKAVLKINVLNEKTDYCMIETGERESICIFMIDAAVDAGYSGQDEDVTGEWREW